MDSGDSTRARKLRIEELKSVVEGTPPGVLACALDVAVSRLDDRSREALRRCPQGAGSFQRAAENAHTFVKAVLDAIRSMPADAQDAIAAAVLVASAESALGSDEYRLPTRRASKGTK